MTDAKRLFQSVQILRLKPDDVIVIEIGRALDSGYLERLKVDAEREFPGHKIIVTSGVRLRVNREEAA